MINFLNKPYPYFSDCRKKLVSYFFIGLFVGSFLAVFQPFEINEWITPYKTLKLFGFGIISFIVPAVLSFSIPNLLFSKAPEKSWTVFKEIITILIVLVFITLGNLFYGRLLHIMPGNAEAYVMAFTFTLLIAIFPVSIHVVIKHNKFLQLNLEQSLRFNEQLRQRETNPQEELKSAEKINTDQNLRLIAENEKDELNILAEDLLFIESADNYSNIVFLQNGQKKKQLLRSSLKRIEGQIGNKNIIRCHRTYIVNLSKIKNIEGNAAGYKLFFNESEDSVPVSRNYIPVFNETLKALK